jgi:Cu/Ag efflux pump CusA
MVGGMVSATVLTLLIRADAIMKLLGSFCLLAMALAVAVRL